MQEDKNKQTVLVTTLTLAFGTEMPIGTSLFVLYIIQEYQENEQKTCLTNFTIIPPVIKKHWLYRSHDSTVICHRKGKSGEIGKSPPPVLSHQITESPSPSLSHQIKKSPSFFVVSNKKVSLTFFVVSNKKVSLIIFVTSNNKVSLTFFVTQFRYGVQQRPASLVTITTHPGLQAGHSLVPVRVDADHQPLTEDEKRWKQLHYENLQQSTKWTRVILGIQKNCIKSIYNHCNHI